MLVISPMEATPKMAITHPKKQRIPTQKKRIGTPISLLVSAKKSAAVSITAMATRRALQVHKMRRT